MIDNFFILDFSYDVVENKPVIYIWAIDKEGNRVVLLEKKFRPYFYALIDDSYNIDEIRKEILKLSKPYSPITSINVEEKKYFGSPVKVLKIETVIPAYVRVYRDEVAKIKGVKSVLEADIRFYMRYSIDNNLKPFYWIEAEVEEIKENNFRVKKVYELKKINKLYEDKIPELKVLAFDIEVYNKYGSPNPRRDPVIIIGVWTKEGGKQFLADKYDDLRAIREFINFVQTYDPDIIVGYNINNFDWPYLLERANIRGIRLDVGRRVNGEPSQGVYGHYSITGRLNVDLYGFAQSIQEVKVKTLENIADYLGVLPKEKRTIVEWYDIPKYWDDEKKRDILLKYNLDDAKSAYLLGEVFIPFGIELTRISGLPLDQLSMASVGHRVEWLLMREAYKYNELIPNKEEREYESYEGGLVISPLPGIHEEVYVLDFSSMYPSIMIKYNIGPDTLVKGECENCWVSPVGHKFRKEPPGLYKNVLEKLIQERKEVKKLMEKTIDEYDKRVLDARQRALKVMANAFYGYMGWLGARWYSKEGAEAVTAWGRQIISDSAKIAKEKGFTVIYGDTDSIFVKGGGDINSLITEISSKFGLEIKIDKIYKRVFFTENKKRYAGLTEDGKIDIVGFEAVRGDWCDLAKQVQTNVIELILKSGKVEDAIKYVKSVIFDLRRYNFRIEDLIIWKTIDKNLDEYDVTAPHVVAAKKAAKAGYLVSKGVKIGYVIVKGSGKISDKAEPYFLVKEKNKIDVEYYIDKQIIPVALRILEGFGVKESSLKTGGVDILSFFKK
ncbi:DNA-directed DNA polymerase [Sulfurisphaera ohwakuensis]|uniref:DNA-directed DNA polymerase n=1 Tax=Sulfurisphaera ohwakuensis TaxID=69656 RepID=UPI0036F33EE3